MEGSHRYEHVRALTERLGDLHAAGYPLPAHLSALSIDGAVGVAQRVAPGHWRDEVSRPLLDQLFEANDRQVGQALPGEDEGWGAFLGRW